MSRTWKWILGILGVLVIAGIIAGGVLMWRNHMAFWGPAGVPGYSMWTERVPRTPYGDTQPGVPFGDDGYPRYHMHDRAWGMPMMGGYAGPYAMMPFGGGFWLLFGLGRLLIPLGILALVAYVFYQMGKRAGAASLAAPRSNPPPPARKVASR